MSKIIVSAELRSRLLAASANGSVVATAVLEELKKPAEEALNGCVNSFASLRCISPCGRDGKTINIKITCCRKDVTNENFPDHGDPNAVDRESNRERISPAKFVSLFKNLSFDTEEIYYFNSAIKCSSKIKIKLESKYASFITAYSEENYGVYVDSSEMPLRNSCMRHADLVGIVADFYTNFAGAKILVAYDGEHNIVGRAIVWPGANICCLDASSIAYPRPYRVTNTSVSVLDRLYYNFEFVRMLLREHAKSLGINLCKTYNTYSSHQELTVLTPFELPDEDQPCIVGREFTGLNLAVPITNTRWYKGGAAYCDTMRSVLKIDNMLYMANFENSQVLCNLQTTGGNVTVRKFLCAACGAVSDGVLCPACHSKHIAGTSFGDFLVGSVRMYNGEKIPSFLLTKKGKPTDNFRQFLLLKKLMN